MKCFIFMCLAIVAAIQISAAPTSEETSPAVETSSATDETVVEKLDGDKQKSDNTAVEKTEEDVEKTDEKPVEKTETPEEKPLEKTEKIEGSGEKSADTTKTSEATITDSKTADENKTDAGKELNDSSVKTNSDNTEAKNDDDKKKEIPKSLCPLIKSIVDMVLRRGGPTPDFIEIEVGPSPSSTRSVFNTNHFDDRDYDDDNDITLIAAPLPTPLRSSSSEFGGSSSIMPPFLRMMNLLHSLTSFPSFFGRSNASPVRRIVSESSFIGRM